MASASTSLEAEPPIQEVIVVGAGIAGLAIANALQQRGLNVKVFERAPRLDRQRGAGTGLSQNGQLCLHSLGFPHQEILKISTPIKEHILFDGGNVLVRSDYPRRLYDKHGSPLTGTLRGDLVEMMALPLRKSGSIHCNQPVTAIQQYTTTTTTKDGHTHPHPRVRVTLASGKTHEADLVIGADGINGVVAPFLLGDKMDPAIYSGFSIFFGVIDDFDKIQPERDTHTGLPLPNASTLKEMVDHPAAIIQVLSPYKLFLVAGGTGKDKKLVWKLGYKTPNPPTRKAWVEEGSVRKELQAHLQRLREKEAAAAAAAAGGEKEGEKEEAEHPVFSVIDSLLARTKDTRLLHFGLFSRGHKPYWHQGRVVVIGDAAHATLPHLGQGANVSIEDAVVLAECLEAHKFRQIEQALASFYEKRQERTKRIVDISKSMGWLLDAESRVGVWARNKLLTYAMEKDWYMKFAEKEVIARGPQVPEGGGGGGK